MEYLVVVWNYAVGSNSVEIIRLCMITMTLNFTDLVSTDLLDSLQFEYMYELLGAENLNLDHEDTKVVAVISWYKAGATGDGVNLRSEELSPLLDQINWNIVHILVANLPELWELAHIADHTLLKQLCLKAMAIYFTEIINLIFFLELEFEYFLVLLQSPHLRVTQENIKWEAVSMWICYESDEIEPNSRIDYLSALVYEINWSVYPRDMTVDLMVDDLILADAKCR